MASGHVVACLLCIAMGSSAPAWATPAGTDASFTNFANEEVRRLANDDGFSGTILIAHGGKVLLRRAGGMTDPWRAIPNRPDTRFPLESLTKQFTATAILLLVKEHKIALDDAIGKYYAPLPPAWSHVTIRQLLTHAAGIVDCNPCAIETYRDYIKLSLAKPPAFPPGDGILYSNAGYGLLAAVIERVSGQSYAQFIAANIFRPLHMTHSGSGKLPPGSALGYTRNAGETDIRAGRRADLEFHTGSGDLYSTVDDMLLWTRAMQTGALLPRALHDAMLTDYGHGYGFGLRLSEKFGQKEIWHTGADHDAGYGSIEELFPKKGLTVIVLFNNLGITKTPITLTVEGKPTTFRATAARELVENLESEYFMGRTPS